MAQALGSLSPLWGPGLNFRLLAIIDIWKVNQQIGEFSGSVYFSCLSKIRDMVRIYKSDTYGFISLPQVIQQPSISHSDKVQVLFRWPVHLRSFPFSIFPLGLIYTLISQCHPTPRHLGILGFMSIQYSMFWGIQPER